MKKSQTFLSIFLWTIIILDFPLMILIIVCISGADVHSWQPCHYLHLCVVISMLGWIVHKYLICYPKVTFILSNIIPVSNLDLMIVIWKTLHQWRYGHMCHQLWTCTLQVLFPCRTLNPVDVASTTENMLCTTMSVASGTI